jgi:L-amino acid N-acyltransferase YncA
MSIRIVPLSTEHLPELLSIWNEIVAEGTTFPWIKTFEVENLLEVFKPEDTVGCAVDECGAVRGMFHVHPNNEGRCAHIANCGYMVSRAARGQGIGRLLVQSSLEAARREGYKGMQFNAVVTTNQAALALYRSEGFKIIGTVPNGFLLKSGSYADMHIMYQAL